MVDAGALAAKSIHHRNKSVVNVNSELPEDFLEDLGASTPYKALPCLLPPSQPVLESQPSTPLPSLEFVIPLRSKSVAWMQERVREHIVTALGVLVGDVAGRRDVNMAVLR